MLLGAQLVLSQLPTIHELRHLNAVATVVAGTVTGLLVAGCISNGASPCTSASNHAIIASFLLPFIARLT